MDWRSDLGTRIQSGVAHGAVSPRLPPQSKTQIQAGNSANPKDGQPFVV